MLTEKLPEMSTDSNGQQSSKVSVTAIS